MRKSKETPFCFQTNKKKKCQNPFCFQIQEKKIEIEKKRKCIKYFL